MNPVDFGDWYSMIGETVLTCDVRPENAPPIQIRFSG